MKSPIVAVAVASALLVLSNEQVFAQDTVPQDGAGKREISLGLGIPNTIDFHGRIGLAVGAFLDYEGSDDFAAIGVPLVDIKQQGFLFARGVSVNPNDGFATLGWNALNFGYDQDSVPKFRLSVGPLARYYRGRDDNDNESLNGLGDIDDTAGLGGFIEASAGLWSAEATVVPYDAGGDDAGILVALGARYTAQIRDRLTISPGISASWGDDDYMQGFYGVTSAQSARSGLADYDAGAGMKDAGVEIGATYVAHKSFVINGQLGYRRLLNDAANSPIVEGNGSRDQFRALLGVAYQF